MPSGRFVLTTVAALAGSLGAILLGATPASAATTVAPPALPGYVSFTPGHASVTCTNSTPTAVSFDTSWDATNLTSSVTLVADTTGAERATRSPQQPVVVEAGKTGSFTSTFPITRASAGETILVEVHAIGSSFDLSTAQVAFTCPAPNPARLSAPTINLSGRDCQGNVTLMLNGGALTKDWAALVTFADGTFRPATAIPAGKTVTVVIPSATTTQLGSLISVAYAPNDQSATTGRGVTTFQVARGTRFTDVDESNHFCSDVEWVAGQGIAHGYEDGSFHPTEAVSREAMAAFLYRFANPDTTPAACTTAVFPDVPAGSKFCPEIRWLVSNHIATGYADHRFHPTAPVSREATAAFMFRYAGSNEADPLCYSDPFRDVPAGSPFCDVITWLVDKKITTGYPDNTFHPTEAVTRQAMAAFLHRLFFIV